MAARILVQVPSRWSGEIQPRNERGPSPSPRRPARPQPSGRPPAGLTVRREPVDRSRATRRVEVALVFSLSAPRPQAMGHLLNDIRSTAVTSTPLIEVIAVASRGGEDQGSVWTTSSGVFHSLDYLARVWLACLGRVRPQFVSGGLALLHPFLLLRRITTNGTWFFQIGDNSFAEVQNVHISPSRGS